MSNHLFILQPGTWIGEGKIAFSASPESVRFYTKWLIEPEKKGLISCEQQVVMQGSEPNTKTQFRFSNVTPTTFSVELDNDTLGKVYGTGVIDPKTIAWEFHTKAEGLEGFEVYELQENGDYMLHAEYASADQFRTIIDGRIWKKSE